MDHGPESKRPRISTSWSASSPHHGVSLPPPAPPTAAHHQANSAAYQPSHPAYPPRQSEPPSLPPPPHPTPQHYDDRRHHDPEVYGPPPPDPRQPPPSPVRPPYSPYTPRDPIVKRDPDDNTLPQLRRPHSTGNAPDGLSGSPAGPPHPPPPQHQDDRRHMSFDGGPPPAMYNQPRQPSYPPPQTPIPQTPIPQTPIAHPPPYDQQHQHTGMFAPQQGEVQYITYTTTKRKAQRASQACDSCRTLKAKCDEQKPCKNCKDKNMECKYRDPQPKQQDKIATDILEGILRMQSEVTSGFRGVSTEFRSLNQWKVKIENALKQINPTLDFSVGPDNEGDVNRFPTSRPASAASLRAGVEETYSPPDDADTVREATAIGGHHEVRGDLLDARVSSQDAHNVLRELHNDDDQDIVPGPPVQPGEPAIPINHTTLAALLLTWPAIHDLCQHLLEKENVKYVSEFPVRQEEQRGLLRLYGRGEGSDYRPSDRDPQPSDYGAVDFGGDDSSDVGAASPADCWGSIGSMSPTSTVDMKGKAVDQQLDLTESVVWKYVDSFEENMQNMHPLLIPKELTAMVKVFLECNKQSTRPSIAKWAASEAGTKRKRSPGAEGPEPPLPPATSVTPVRPQRTIQNAIIFLVLALGKICLHTDSKLPDVVAENDPPIHNSPVVRNGVLMSPTQGSPPSNISQAPSYGSFPSPKDATDRGMPSRRSSFQGSGSSSTTLPVKSRRKNYGVIPGLDYFAVATDIIGNQLGGATLNHVHAHILAGLYHGQLGRVIESAAYISNAARALQNVLRPHMERFRQMHEARRLPQTKRDNQMIFAFWTCLQLESDILAELPLPQSHILAYEETLPYPNMDLAIFHGCQLHVVESYTAQLYLRKRLNDLHKLFYAPTNTALQLDQGGYYPPSASIQNTIKHILEGLRVEPDSIWVPKTYLFNPREPPARDILSARLRAKWWGAHVITFRPFIKQVLGFNWNREHPPAESQPGDPYAGADAQNRDEVDPLVLEYAERGINALKESTKAFHNVPAKRFIVTNVFGTAHAQWGNLITLAAAYKDRSLSRFINESELRELFAKTIAFFKVIAQASSALYVDMKILEGLDRELWSRPVMDRRADSSFSSSSGHHHPISPSAHSHPPPMPYPNAPTPNLPGTPLPPMSGFSLPPMSVLAPPHGMPGTPVSLPAPPLWENTSGRERAGR